MSVYKKFLKDKIIDLSCLTRRGNRAFHGDVVIIKCDESDFPENFKDLPVSKNMVLAEGEHSGHAHALFAETDLNDYYQIPNPRSRFKVIDGEKGTTPGGQFDVRVNPKGAMFLKVENEPMILRHQEHKPFRIHPGYYEITRQTEMWDDMKRAVVD